MIDTALLRTQAQRQQRADLCACILTADQVLELVETLDDACARLAQITTLARGALYHHVCHDLVDIREHLEDIAYLANVKSPVNSKLPIDNVADM